MTSVATGFIYGDTITPEWRRSYNNMLMQDLLSTKRIVMEHSLYAAPGEEAEARNKIIKLFLNQDPKAEWLFLMDTNVVFAMDILDKLLINAGPEKPIIGALQFKTVPADINPTGVQSFNVEPMIYVYRGDDIYTVNDYVFDLIMKCSAVPASCMLIHRSVLADPRWLDDRHPLPWFRQTVRKGTFVEDFHRFCGKAEELGYPIHVNTSARTGRVIKATIDEEVFLRMTRPQVLKENANKTIYKSVPVS